MGESELPPQILNGRASSDPLSVTNAMLPYLEDMKARVLTRASHDIGPPKDPKPERAFTEAEARGFTAKARDPEPALIPVSQVESRPIEWLMKGYLPIGKLVMVDGPPGVGKSTAVLDFVARASCGRTMPDDSTFAACNSLILAAEDDASDTIRPRLEAAAADIDRVFMFPLISEQGAMRALRLDQDLLLLEKKLREHSIKILVLDPLTAFLGSGNANRESDVRRVLGPFTKMIGDLGVVAIAIRHLNKSDGVSAYRRGIGSVGIIAQARVGLLVAVDPGDASRCVLIPYKGNLSAKSSALAFRLVTTPAQVPRVEWLGTSDVTETELLSAEVGAGVSRLEDAVEFLRTALHDGPVASREIESAAKANGITAETLKRARKRLGVKAIKPGGAGTPWQLALPADPLERVGQRGSSSELNPFEPVSEDASPRGEHAMEEGGLHEPA